MVVSWDSVFVQFRLTTKRIFRVKERDHISPPSLFECVLFIGFNSYFDSSISLTSLYYYRLYQFGFPASTRRSLVNLGIDTVSVSTTFSFVSIIRSAFPPSMASFQNPDGNVIIKPILKFLEKTNSSFLVNLYPYYYMYQSNISIPIGFALFEDPFSYMDDSSTIQVRYGNLFDVMVDAVVNSLAVMGYGNLPVVVAETGWPRWSSVSSEIDDATPKCSETFLNALVDHLPSGKGTPLRKEGVSEVFIFELCNKESKQQRTWGLLNYHLKTKMNTTFFLDISDMEKKFLCHYFVIVFTLFAGVITTVAILTCLTNILAG
ncbi:hypothetical protein N665_6959s0001 [Sinapis alba]|nr:hypothetical protein N665_6959s0001 [Sinapis alba]